ncbi:hypothetical protein LCGC14_1650590 [marine sediment metagenome]|uniref:Uncharacterized protein n=1 Tax=marine sediment metagenome TaxID=412755 RepID=A0A0F9HXP3_9ZZZZ
MKITYGPLVQSASGRFGGVVASSWKGIDLVRRFRSPANPDTTAQRNVRDAFTNLNRCYVRMTANIRAAWVANATGKAFLARNHWIGLSTGVIAGDANLDDLVMTPGDSSTVGPVGESFTPAATQITLACDQEPTITGWTFTQAIAVVLEDYDPTVIQTFQANVWVEDVDPGGAPISIVITGLASGIHQCGIFFEWVAPDGTTRYSVAARGQATVP